MSQDAHQSAERLILQEQVEGLSAGEREWLDRHLEDCPQCARIADATNRALRRFRALPVPVPAALASRTQARVYLRGREVRQRRSTWALWAACAVSWVLGIGSAPYVWRVFRWLGDYTGLPAPLWKAGVALWWAVPALLAVAVLLLETWNREETEKRSENVRL